MSFAPALDLAHNGVREVERAYACNVCMVTFGIFALLSALIAARVTSRLLAGEHAISRYRDLIQAAEQGTRSGAVDLRRALAACGAAVASVGEGARRRGLPIGSGLRALRAQLARATELQRDSRRLWQLYLGRTVAVLALAGLGRAYLWIVGLSDEASRASRLDDAAALALAGIILASSQIVFARRLPRPWVWRDGLTDTARCWLETHLIGRAVAGGPLNEELEALRANELKSGVSMERERKLLLAEWGREAGRADRHRLRACEDLLPVLELIGIGLPAALILVVPAAAFVRSWS